MRTDYDAFRTLLDEHDGKPGQHPTESDMAALRNAIAAFFSGKEVPHSVLGIDIYRYSKFPSDRQRIIPFVFRELYDFAADFVTERETFLFSDRSFRQRFISTGDGGFQLFDTPLHGFVFALYFQLAVSAFNSYVSRPATRQLLGPLSLRYCLTYADVFCVDNNFFGPAIIRNARILARDALNRLLLDGETVDWFEKNIGGLESMLALGAIDLPNIRALSDYDKSTSRRTYIFAEPSVLRSLHVQKIGVIQSKQDAADVYSVHAQGHFERTGAGPGRKMVITLGNLNATGIS